jgi:hypothetical protein
VRLLRPRLDALRLGLQELCPLRGHRDQLLRLVHEARHMLADERLGPLVRLVLDKPQELLDAADKVGVRAAVIPRVARLLGRRDDAQRRVVPLHAPGARRLRHTAVKAK